jgi:hypothetical protein
MILYHGTTAIIGGISLEKSRLRTDFGRGFYLTDKIGTAQVWAIRKCEELTRGTPTILQYTIDDALYSLEGKRFPLLPDEEWLIFICTNRKRIKGEKNEPRHKYNWVSGPIADDKVVDVVDEYMRGDISVNDAIVRLKALPQTYQLSLHTQEALSLVNEETVTLRRWQNGSWTKKWQKRKQ